MDQPMPTRLCCRCKQRKPLDEFYSNPRKPACRRCFGMAIKAIQAERREWLDRYKTDRGCMDCGYNGPPCTLDFDHRPGVVKLYPPHQLKALGSWELIYAEVAKCDVVCANCHRIRTHVDRPSANYKYDLRRDEKAERPRYRSDDPGQPGLFVA